MAGAQSSLQRVPYFQANGVQVPVGSPYHYPGQAAWTPWGDGAYFSSMGSANQGVVGPLQDPMANPLARPEPLPATTPAPIEIVPWQESKKTRQRRLQRQAKKNYRDNTRQWPANIVCTEKGEIDKSTRIFVHKHITATAKRFLDLSKIHFRDHSNAELKVVEDDISRDFKFNPPLPEGFIIWYIEEVLRTSRCQWRKFWVEPGRGQKHRQCPAQFFPALEKYWRAPESEEESRRMTEARAAARNAWAACEDGAEDVDSNVSNES